MAGRAYLPTFADPLLPGESRRQHEPTSPSGGADAVMGTESMPSGSSAPVPSAQVAEVVRQLEARAQDAHSVALAELRRYVEIDPKSWPLPDGYRARLGPAYFAHVYGNAKKGSEYGLSFLKAHGLEDCYAAQEIVSILEFFDRLMFVDRVEGFINWPSSEYMLRRAYGLELAFGKCRNKHDWNRGTSAPKTWKSKVDWGAARQYDPSFRLEGAPIVSGAEEEVRKEQEREAALLKARSKLAEHGGSGTEAPNMGS